MHECLWDCFTQKKLLIFTSYLVLTNTSPRKLNHSQTEQVTAAPSHHHPHLVTCSEHFYLTNNAAASDLTTWSRAGAYCKKKKKRHEEQDKRIKQKTEGNMLIRTDTVLFHLSLHFLYYWCHQLMTILGSLYLAKIDLVLHYSLKTACQVHTKSWDHAKYSYPSCHTLHH